MTGYGKRKNNVHTKLGSRTMKVIQVELSDGTDNIVTTWVDRDLIPHTGKIFKDKTGRKWYVRRVYRTIIDSKDLHKDWKVEELR